MADLQNPSCLRQREGFHSDRRLIAIYLAAHGSKTLFWTASDLYFVYYLNQICGIRPALTGLIVGFSLVLAAFADRHVGAWLQAVADRPALIRRWQRIGGVSNGIIFLLFAMTAYIAADWKVACAIISLMGMRLSYALVDIPQNALLSWSGWAPSQITTLVAGRNIVGGVARLMLALIFVPIMVGPVAGGKAAWFFGLVCVIAVLLAASAALLATNFPRLDDTGPPIQRSLRPAVAIQILRMGLLSFMLTGFTQIEPYLVSQAAMTIQSGTLFMTCVSLGGLIGQPWWRWRIMKHPPSRVHAEILVMALLASGIILSLPLDNVVIGSLAGVLSGSVGGGLLLLAWADFARGVRDHDSFRAFGVFTGVAKLGQALATTAMGAWLDWHLPPSAAAHGPAFRLVAGGFVMAAAIVLILLHRSRQSVHRHVHETSS